MADDIAEKAAVCSFLDTLTRTLTAVVRPRDLVTIRILSKLDQAVTFTETSSNLDYKTC
jgi:hypothetical protein